MKALSKQLNEYAKRTYGIDLNRAMKRMDPERARAMGEALIRTFAEGIDKAGNVLPGTMERLMKIVDEYLPHSPAKRGPLSRLGKVGPGMLDTIIEGLIKSSDGLEKAMEKVTDPLEKVVVEKTRLAVNEAATLLRVIQSEWKAGLEKNTVGQSLGSLLRALGGGGVWRSFTDGLKVAQQFLSTGLGKMIDAQIGGALGRVVSAIAGFLGEPAAGSIVGVVITGMSAALNVLNKVPVFRSALRDVRASLKPLWDSLKQTFAPFRDVFRDFAKVAAKLVAVIAKIGVLIVLKPLISLLSAAIKVLTPALNAVATGLDAVSSALDALSTWLDDFGKQVSEFIMNLNPLDVIAKSLWFVGNLLAGAVRIFVNIFKAIGQLIGGIAGILSKGIGGLIGGALGWIKGLFGFAEGGLVVGLGTSTSDNLLARLSPGEFVVNAEATRKNLPVLQAINEGKPLPLQPQTLHVTINIYDASDPRRVREEIENFFKEYALMRA